MTAKTEKDVELLRQSANHWKRVSAGDEDAGYLECPLCQQYRVCMDCPIFEYTGESNCTATPWTTWADHMEVDHNESPHRPAYKDCKYCVEIADEFVDYLFNLANQMEDGMHKEDDE
jgi:hypothetical protein